MKLKDYINILNELVDKNPEALDFKVVCAIDDEGNGFNEVHYDPTIGFFDGESHGDFTSQDAYLEEPEEYGCEFESNSVCLN